MKNVCRHLAFYFVIMPRDIKMLDDLISVEEAAPEPEPEPELCQPMIKPIPICLANVKACNQMKETAKTDPTYNREVRKYKDICQANYDDYEKFIRYKCEEAWCQEGRRNQQTWEKGNTERSSGNTKDNKEFCDDVDRKFVAFLHLNCSTPSTKGKYNIYERIVKQCKVTAA